MDITALLEEAMAAQELADKFDAKFKAELKKQYENDGTFDWGLMIAMKQRLLEMKAVSRNAAVRVKAHPDYESAKATILGGK